MQREIDKHQRRLGEIRHQLEGLTTSQIASGEVELAFAKFDPLWNAMSPLDQND